MRNDDGRLWIETAVRQYLMRKVAHQALDIDLFTRQAKDHMELAPRGARGRCVTHPISLVITREICYSGRRMKGGGGMRNWLWRALACAGGGIAGCGAPWAFVPVKVDRSLSEAFLLPSPAKHASTAICHSLRRRRGRSDELAEESEALLAGRYHELLLGNHGQALPGWAWMNPLAHAECAELKRLANLSPNRDDPLAFLSYLAHEVLLRTGEDDKAIRQIQHDTLVPLELALLRQAGVSDLTGLARTIQDQLEYPTRRSLSQHPPQSRCSQDGGPAMVAVDSRRRPCRP